MIGTSLCAQLLISDVVLRNLSLGMELLSQKMSTRVWLFLWIVPIFSATSKPTVD